MYLEWYLVLNKTNNIFFKNFCGVQRDYILIKTHPNMNFFSEYQSSKIGQKTGSRDASIKAILYCILNSANKIAKYLNLFILNIQVKM